MNACPGLYLGHDWLENCSTVVYLGSSDSEMLHTLAGLTLTSWSIMREHYQFSELLLVNMAGVSSNT